MLGWSNLECVLESPNKSFFNLKTSCSNDFLSNGSSTNLSLLITLIAHSILVCLWRAL